MIAKILKENVPDCDIQVFCPHNEIVCGYISPNAGLMYHDNHNELTGDAFYLWGDQSSSYLRYSLQTNLDFYSGLLGAFSKTRNTSDDLGIGKGNIAITLADTIQQRLANINKESPIVIVDDLCDAGGTFIAEAQYLRDICHVKNPLYLFVAHGLFTKGLEPLLKHFDRIICTNSYQDITHPKVTQIQVI